MANTGAPWNIPYVEPSDLVRDYPAADEAQADAIAAGLSAAGGLVEVKSALFTGTQTASVTAGNNVAVTDLTITHETADAANKLVILASIGQAASSRGAGSVGIAIHDGTGLIGVGAADGARTPVGSGTRVVFSDQGDEVGTILHVMFVHTPGAGSKTFTVRAINADSATQTVFVNRNQGNADNANSQRAVSSLVIQEVKV